MNSPSPSQLAREAREALSRFRETPEEHFQRLIHLGWINARGEVTRLLGGDAEPEPGEPTIDAQSLGKPNGAAENGR